MQVLCTLVSATNIIQCNTVTLNFDLYFRLDEKLCLSHLPRVFSICMTCLLSERMEVACSATKTMKVCDFNT